MKEYMIIKIENCLDCPCRKSNDESTWCETPDGEINEFEFDDNLDKDFPDCCPLEKMKE